MPWFALTTHVSGTSPARRCRSGRSAGRLRSTRSRHDIGRVPDLGFAKPPGAPARSSFYVVGSRCEVTLRPGKGIIVSTQERALHVCNCGVAERVKQPFVEVVVAPLTGLLTSGWSNTRLVAVNTIRDVDDLHKLPSIINCDAARRST